MNEDLTKKLEEEAKSVESVPLDEEVNLVLIIGGNEVGHLDIPNEYVQAKRWDAIQRGIELIEIENNIEHVASPLEQLENHEINFRIEVKQ
jgi:hypothetical protein